MVAKEPIASIIDLSERCYDKLWGLERTMIVMYGNRMWFVSRDRK
jgi:hypothetical protein